MRHIIVMVVVLSLALASGSLAAELFTDPFAPPEVPELPQYVPYKIVVKFDSATMAALNRETAPHGRLDIPALDRVGARFGVAAVVPQFQGVSKRKGQERAAQASGWHVIKFQDEVDVTAAATAYWTVPGVVAAYPVGFLKFY